MHCSKCGRYIKEDSVFCESCGSQILFKEKQKNEIDNHQKPICPRCNTEAKYNSLFCGECGYKFPAIKEFKDDAINNVCSKCGSEINVSTGYCSKCGSKIDNKNSKQKKEKNSEKSEASDESTLTFLKDEKTKHNNQRYNIRYKNNDLPAKPNKVSKAIVLLWISLGIGILNSIISLPQNTRTAPIGFIITIDLFIFILEFFLIYWIGNRKNWGRLIYLILTIIGIPFSIGPIIKLLQLNQASGLLTLSQIFLQIIALVFLYQRESSNWFNRNKT